MGNNKNKKIIAILLTVAVITCIVMACFKEAKSGSGMKPSAVVELTEVEERDIYDTMTSTGRIEAKYSVDVVARVQGWIKKSYFTEGATVQKGALLFLIEPDNYQIAVNQAKANLQKCQADYANAEKNLKRADELVKLDYVSKSYYDNALAARDMTKAAVEAAKATLADANLKLSYTKIYAPEAGKVGKILITQGNLVDTMSGPLTKIVSINPMYVYFTVKSEDYLNFKKNDDKDFSSSNVELTLADGSLYDQRGKIEFIDNQVDPTVGTIGLRATFANPNGVLVPSDYVNVKITGKKPRHVVLVAQEAVQDTKDGMMSYTVDKDNNPVPRLIKIDGQYDGKWIVTEGLTAGEKVISKGILSIRPGQKVVVAEPKAQAPQNAQEAKKDAEETKVKDN